VSFLTLVSSVVVDAVRGRLLQASDSGQIGRRPPRTGRRVVTELEPAADAAPAGRRFRFIDASTPS
jgi:hypothetical protein